MNQTPKPCPDCRDQLVWLACKYPFWYHASGTPRHGEWVPDHNCVADASRATAGDVHSGCGEAA